MRQRHGMRRSVIVAALVAGAGALVGAGPKASEAVSEHAVVARIGQTTYTLADVWRRLARLEAPYRYAAARRLPEYVKAFLRREVLAREARRRVLDRDPAVQAEFEEGVHAVLLLALAQRVTAETMPGPEDVRASYQAHAAEFRLPEQVEGDQVRVRSEAEGEAIRAAVAAGQPFEAAVEARTEALVDGATFSRGMRAPKFERGTVALQVGEVSPPVRTRDGISLVRLRAHHPARLQPLAAASPPSQARLSAHNRERLWKQLEERLWAAEGVQIREDLQGRPPSGSRPGGATAPGAQAPLGSDQPEQAEEPVPPGKGGIP